MLCALHRNPPASFPYFARFFQALASGFALGFTIYAVVLFSVGLKALQGIRLPGQ